MASLSEINIDLRFTGLDKIEKATKASRQFQREINSLVKEEKSGALTTAQFASRVGDLAGKLQRITGDYGKAAHSVFDYSRNVKQLVEQERELAAQQKAVNDARAQARANRYLREEYEKEAAAMAKVASEAQSYINSVAMSERANKSAADSAKLFEAQLARVDAANAKTAQAFGESVRAANTYEMANKSASDSADVFMRQIERVEAANLKTAQSFGDSVRAANTYEMANKSAEASAEVFTRELARQEQQAAETARAHQQALNALRETSLANKSAADSADVFGAEMDRLRAKFNPIYAASQRYEQALNELNQAHRMGVVNAQQYETALEQLNMELANGTTGMGVFNTANGAMRQGMSRASVAIQQTGYQVGDFLVQVQSGTNAFVAFGQQATQLAGLLTLSMNPVIIAIGAALSIAIPLVTAFGAAWMRTRQETDDAAEGIKALEEQLSSARSSLDGFIDRIEMANRGLKDTGELAFSRAIDDALRQIEEAEIKLADAQERRGQGSRAVVVNAQSELSAAQELLETRRAELEEYRKKREEAERIGAIEQTIKDNFLRRAEAEQDMVERGRRAAEEYEKLRVARQDALQAAMQEREMLSYIVRYGEESSEVDGLRLQRARERAIAEADALKLVGDSRAEYIAVVMESYKLKQQVDAIANSTSKLLSEYTKMPPLLRTITDLVNKAYNNSSLLSKANIAVSSTMREIAGIDISGPFARALGFASGLLRAVSQLRKRPIAGVRAAPGELGFGGAGGQGTFILGPDGKPINVSAPSRTEGLSIPTVGSLGVDIPSDTGGTSGGAATVSATQQAEEYLAGLRRESELKRQLVGLNEDDAYALERSTELKQRLESIEEGLSVTYEDRIDQMIQMELETQKLMEKEEQRQQLMNTIESNIENAFMSMVDGSKSVEDAFKGMLRNIILEIYRQQVAQPAATIIGDFIGGLFGSANGNVFNRGAHVKAYADGGIVSSPTYFPMRGNQTGLMGEAGPEAIMPLKRTKSGKLGVVAEGGGNVTINQSFNFSANGDESVKRIVRGEIPRITEATKAAVADAKRRGGSYGRAFS